MTVDIQEGGVKIAIDRGGTFTDVLAVIPGQEDYVFKLLSVDPNNYKDANIEGIRRVIEYVTKTEIPRGSLLDTSMISSIRLGTTVGTNALLERKGARCAFITTKGMKDMLHIGDQSRPDLFALKIIKPKVLYKEVVEMDERVTLPAYTEDPDFDEEKWKAKVDGKEYVYGTTGEVVQILKELDVEEARAKFVELKEKGIVSIAICLVHGYNFRDHELQLKKIAQEVGFEFVVTSHELLPMIKCITRGQSTVVDAYLTPIIIEYISNFLAGLEPSFESTTRIEFMQSDGGLCAWNKFSGLSSLLSGPAGGVVGAEKTCYDKEEKTPIVGFDMGGTSTDVSRFAGQYNHVFESTTAGIQVAASQLDINTVAAGGGSILSYKNGVFVVGPESASSHPGPACYKKGGPLTVTDANLFTGRILPEFFPKIFGPEENEALDYDIVKKKFEELTELINLENPEVTKTPQEVALGFLQVANVNMAKPIRALTETRGYDVSKHNLASFGGAGGQHAASIAQLLKINRVLIHKYSSILSAYGIALADVVKELQEPCHYVYNEESKKFLLEKCDGLKKKVTQELISQKIQLDTVQYEVFFNMGYAGSDTTLMIMKPDDGDFEKEFLIQHKREFSFIDDTRSIIISDIRVRGYGNTSHISVESPFTALKKINPVAVASDLHELTTPIFFDEGKFDSKVYKLNKLPIGSIVEGPSMILDETQTIIVSPNSKATVLPKHIIIDLDVNVKREVSTDYVDPIQLAVFSNRFIAIAEDMGRTLQKISISANIKERMDFSCALFDADGNLTANAPHVPVHLGSMSFSIKYAKKYWGDNLLPGDVVATNHPAAGGTHLPDITIISPVFIDGKLVFFTASRAHHSEIGGGAPGSCPAHATNLWQEGAQFEAWKIVSQGKFDYDGVNKYFVEEPASYPGCSGSRKLRDNISDLKAQIAANQRGVNLLTELFKEYSKETVLYYMTNVKKSAELAVRTFLKKFALENKDKLPLKATEILDDGSRICVTISIDGTKGEAVYDFEGTSEEAFNPYNAPPSVTYACVIYGLRCLINADIPLNEGCLIPIQIKIPKGTLLNPSIHAAVSAGNASTSQRVNDTIFKAYAVCGAGTGSMNSFSFGKGGVINGVMKQGYGMVETIGGGSGACEGCDGFSGTQVHMTNTRITDPEILEKRYPIVLRDFSVRHGTGGIGKWKGGDGLQRVFEFTDSVIGSLKTLRRVNSPYGMQGGGDGARGENKLGKKEKDGTIRWVHIPGFAQLDIEPGDIVIVRTPGGGGFGVPVEGESRNGDEDADGINTFVPLAGGTLGNITGLANTSQ